MLVFSIIGLMNPTTETASPPADPQVLQETETAAPPAPDTVAQAPAAPVEGVNVTVSVVGEKSWMQAHADGADAAVFTGTKFAGDVLTLNAQQSLKIIIGNAGAVRVNVNGRDLGPPGQNGAVGTFIFTPESTNFVGG
jgi:hypothetical protein